MRIANKGRINTMRCAPMQRQRQRHSQSSHTFRRNVICLKIDRTWKTPNELKLKCPLIMKLLRLFYFYTPDVVGSCERSRISTWPKREQSTKTTHCKNTLSRSTAGETHHCSPCRETIKADVRLWTVLSAQLGGQANTPFPRWRIKHSHTATVINPYAVCCLFRLW